jgi:uncharacterized protein YchJ
MRHRRRYGGAGIWGRRVSKNRKLAKKLEELEMVLKCEDSPITPNALPPAPAPSVGSNQPYPCGSGRKSKKCCGR